jgi:hypothetical protein
LQNGGERDGSIKMIREVGFSGTVVIIWEDVYPVRIQDRLGVGRLYEGTPARLFVIAGQRTSCVGGNKDRCFFSGLMIHDAFELFLC